MDSTLKRWFVLWGGIALAGVALAVATNANLAYLLVILALGMIGGALFGTAGGVRRPGG